MAVVQWWELALALVWWRTTRKQPNRPTGDFDTPRSQKEIRRLEAAFLRTPAQAVREAVSPVLETETAAELEELQAERNRLAHRFLRDPQGDAGGSSLEAIAQLNNLRDRFDRAVRSIMWTMESFGQYHGPVREHWNEVGDRILDRLFSGRAVPRDPGLQQTPRTRTTKSLIQQRCARLRSKHLFTTSVQWNPD